MTKTLDQIRRGGLAALRRELGRAGMIRFLQQFESGSGDYAKERHAWVDGTSFAEIQAAARRKRAKKKMTPQHAPKPPTPRPPWSGRSRRTDQQGGRSTGWCTSCTA